jgi:hypothetical protein
MADLDIVLRLGLLAKTMRDGSWFDREAVAEDAEKAKSEIERLREGVLKLGQIAYQAISEI